MPAFLRASVILWGHTVGLLHTAGNDVSGSEIAY